MTLSNPQHRHGGRSGGTPGSDVLNPSELNQAQVKEDCHGAH